MAIFSTRHSWISAFGVLGNIVSVMVYLAPLSTFYNVYKKKSTEGFQCFPYVVALFSSMLWIYYALVKTEAYFLIIINVVGCVIESVYIIIYILYSPKNAKMLTVRLLLFLNVGVFSSILIVTLCLVKSSNRVKILGWICVVFSVCVFAAPLSIIRLVIRTRSVDYMPLPLSLFLTLSAVLWFFYGFLLKDLYIAMPNILGFVFGIIQMLLHFIYKNSEKVAEEPRQPREKDGGGEKLNEAIAMEIPKETSCSQEI